MSIMTELAIILKNIAFRLHIAHSGKESEESKCGSSYNKKKKGGGMSYFRFLDAWNLGVHEVLVFWTPED